MSMQLVRSSLRIAGPFIL